MSQEEYNSDVDVDYTNEVDVPDEVDVVGDSAPEDKAAKKAAAKKGDLPEGYVTPIGFAKILGERGLQKDRNGEVLQEVRPQMVYSYIRNAHKDNPFPLIKGMRDSNDQPRDVIKIEDGVAWWEAKNERAAARTENAKAKAEKKAAKAEEKSSDEGETDSGPVTEAE